MTDARAYLNSKGIHFSQQRIAIMDYLMKHCTHPTVEEIFGALSPHMPTLSRTTVYNTLKLFQEHDAIQVINIDEKIARFDACMEPHAHFLCLRCGKVYDIPIPFDPATHKLTCNPALQDFTICQTHIYHKGICPSCKTSENSIQTSAM